MVCFCAGVLVALAPAGAAPAPGATDAAALTAITAARSGDWPKAYAQAGQSKEPLAQKIVRWLDDTRANPSGRFAEIAAFIAQNPDWPLQKTLRRRAEEGMGGESDDVAAAWFERNPPLTGAGRARAAQIQIDRGDAAAGAAALRAAWVGGDFSPAKERELLARFAATLRPEDHETRLDRLLWDGDAEAARRMLPLVPPDYRALAEARLALAVGAKSADALLSKLPAGLRGDPGLAFEQARAARKANNFDAAAQVLLSHPDKPVRPAAWWKERLKVARLLLAAGNAEVAYRLVQQDGGPVDGEAEFVSGYIALHFRHDPSHAFNDFARALGHTASPYAEARAAYWGGRAADAAGKPDLARQWYETGAGNMATFYGQLAAHQLGHDAPPHPVPEPRPDATRQARFDAQELVRAADLLFAASDADHARLFVMQLASRATTLLDFAMLASFAEAHGRFDLAIAVAQAAVAAGMPLMLHGYPVTALPSGGIPERPLLLAIVRQESEFAPDALSPVGARGLMQLMPATAQNVAGQLQLPFSLPRLTSDGLYNLTLGRTYLEKLLDDFGGSYALAIAAYNAGPGRVRQWLHEFGDPRGPAIGMVDWIEMIPFNETRAYVQRVMENLQVYRGQDTANVAAFSLVADLAR